ncbi:uncharacterized protein LOC125947681 [Dermacentor silvarum]|uniref:uncharacterized protein LOC125947681 n=1 Tax=Dermacentor silvarum TaxID=543639 RepID=UPI0021011229|nr:uncharacterized protein LOC125947681 [Dermacentor silvarum]
MTSEDCAYCGDNCADSECDGEIEWYDFLALYASTTERSFQEARNSKPQKQGDSPTNGTPHEPVECTVNTAYLLAFQATLVSTPIPISVPMPMPSGGFGGQSAPIVINPPGAPPAPPPVQPPPPPEPRPSPAQEMASAMMLTMVDYMRRRLDKQLEGMSEDGKSKSSKPGVPLMSSVSLSPAQWSSQPLTPLAPMPSADTPQASTPPDVFPTTQKKSKKKMIKGIEMNSISEEAAWVKESRQTKQPPAAPVHAISKQGADVVEKLQSEFSPDEKSDSASPAEEEEEGSGEGSPKKEGCCSCMRCCCLCLWLVLLLAALGLAIAYLIFPNEIGDFLCNLGIDKLTGQAADVPNDLNISKLLNEPEEEEWGRSIFDVEHITDEPPFFDSFQDDQGVFEEEYDDAANSSSAVTPPLTTTAAISLTPPDIPSSVSLQAPHSLANDSTYIEYANSILSEDDPDDIIHFDSFIDIAAFGRALKPSSTLPTSSLPKEPRVTVNATTQASRALDLAPTPPSGIRDLLIRFGLATSRADVKANATRAWQSKEATTGAPVAIELDDEGEEWPVFGGLGWDTAKTTVENQGAVTLGNFRMPLVKHVNERANKKYRL